jgi:hypothetical protein
MMTTECKVESEQLTDDAFYDRFKKDYLPSYEFFRLFFAVLSLQGKMAIKSSKLKDFIYSAKKEGKYKELLDDISVFHNGVAHISRDIEENLSTLQMLGALGRSNPTYETIFNYYSKESATDTAEQLKEYGDEMENLTKDFISFINTKGE